MPELSLLPERIQGKIDVREDGCWAWTACLNPNGYGRLNVSRRPVLAHRHIYGMLVGAPPNGLELDHLCRVRCCVNPAHLEPVTHAQNMGRSLATLKTHCPQGHPYDEANTYRRPDRPNTRDCRTCRRVARRAAMARLRARRRTERATAAKLAA